MSNECCGKICVTPYCPICGSRVNPDTPLSTLLDHCRSRVKQARASLVQMEGHAMNGPGAVRQRRIVTRWQGWVDLLLDYHRLSL